MLKRTAEASGNLFFFARQRSRTEKADSQMDDCQNDRKCYKYTKKEQKTNWKQLYIYEETEKTVIFHCEYIYTK